MTSWEIVPCLRLAEALQRREHPASGLIEATRAQRQSRQLHATRATDERALRDIQKRPRILPERFVHEVQGARSRLEGALARLTIRRTREAPRSGDRSAPRRRRDDRRDPSGRAHACGGEAREGRRQATREGETIDLGAA